MFIVLLKFSEGRGRAAEFMEGHKKWIKQGFDDGVFLLVGSIKPGLGGAVVAHNSSLADMKARVDADPFVSEKIVTAEILEIEPAKTDERLQFFMED